jgi:hypothetical protein
MDILAETYLFSQPIEDLIGKGKKSKSCRLEIKEYATEMQI